MRCVILFFLSFSLVTISGCEDKNDQYTSFQSYLQNNFTAEPKEGLYAVLPIGSCKACFDSVVLYLSYRGNNDNITVILVGSSALTLNLHKDKIKDFNVLMDNGNHFFKYDITDASYPILLEVMEKRIINVERGDTDNLINIKRVIDGYY